ncbi:MAG: TetR/AcrR family transcriptional regulator, partial [Cyanobacteria bacterium]|nr:TetR/AcrR family transcriptional regulator [Cyanobacteriota bacterium]
MNQDPFQKLTIGRSKGRPPKSFEMPPNSCMENQIILHAKTLFRQKGFSSISISEIVESIGVSKPTLYYYFKDKEHLYTSVLCHMLSIGGEYIQEEMNQA